MDTVFQALSDPTRRRILEILSRNDATAGEIASEFEIGFPAVSHHLTILKRADLVTATREGQNIRYRLNTTIAQETVQHLMNLFSRKRRG